MRHRVGGAVIGVVLTGVLGACSHQDKTPHDYSGAVYQSQVDPKTGDIVFPLDRFYMSDEETQILQNAQSVARSVCESEHGYRTTPRKDIPEIGGSSFFGLWVLANAEKFGYTEPMLPAKAAAISGKSGSADEVMNRTDAQQKILEDCAKTPEVSRFNPPSMASPGGMGEATEKLEDEVYSDKRAKTVIAAWSHCLEAHGLHTVASDGMPEIQGADYDHITEASVKIAVQDVKCKTQVNLVPTLADVEASYEDPIVEKYLPELQANRAKIDAKLTDARAYLAANKDAFASTDDTSDADD